MENPTTAKRNIAEYTYVSLTEALRTLDLKRAFGSPYHTAVAAKALAEAANEHARAAKAYAEQIDDDLARPHVKDFTEKPHVS
jgi:hypothetical protein